MLSLRIVLKIGGHLFSRKDCLLDKKYLVNVSNILKECIKKTKKMVVVVGGGYIARNYIDVGKGHLSESVLDTLGIEISRINASLLYSLVTETLLPRIPRSLEETLDRLTYYDFITIGGYQPGQSTTTVAALTAEAIKADKLLIATNVEGVYDSDPNLNPNAKLLKKVKAREIEDMFSKNLIAGEYRLLDIYSLKIIERSKISTIIFNGKNPENILRALKGMDIGTLIIP